MAYYHSEDGPRKGKYDTSVGLDIDQSEISGNIYDYDLLKRSSVGAVDSNIIIPETDLGIPSIDDYIINQDGSKQAIKAHKRSDGMDTAIHLRNFLAENQEDTLGDMEARVNNGRLNDIKNIKDIILPDDTEIVIHKDNQSTAIKGILEQNSINDIFFSDINIKSLQDSIRYGVYQETNEVISEQSPNELYIIMRSIMLQYANFRTGVDNIVDEIKRLNGKVLIYSITNITSNVKQHMNYIDELAKLPIPLDRPVYHNKQNFTYDISNLLE